jgi:hypothetical protein
VEAPRVWVTRNLAMCSAERDVHFALSGLQPRRHACPFYARFAGTTDLADFNLVAEPWGQPFESRAAIAHERTSVP